jgi:hydrogenase expression/formation protein HypD
VLTAADDLGRLAAELRDEAGPGLTFMEVCGTHTMAIARYGLRQLLPDGVRLVSGPGCPVCVTAMADLDRVLALARLPEVTLVTFGDLIRVPASRGSLAAERAAGADVRVE